MSIWKYWQTNHLNKRWMHKQIIILINLLIDYFNQRRMELIKYYDGWFRKLKFGREIYLTSMKKLNQYYKFWWTKFWSNQEWKCWKRRKLNWWKSNRKNMKKRKLQSFQKCKDLKQYNKEWIQRKQEGNYNMRPLLKKVV